MFARWGRFFYRRRWAVLALPDKQGDAWLPVSTQPAGCLVQEVL